MMNEIRLYMMAGCPASGKSFTAKKLAEKLNCKIISRDEVRFSIVQDDEEYFSHETKVFNTFAKQIKEELLEKGICIADATHLTLASRRKLINKLNISNLKVTVYFIKTPLNICIERNMNRTGRSFVPTGAIRRMFYTQEEPYVGELPEIDLVEIAEQED